MSAYAELVCATNFSFLRGASPASDMVKTALMLGHTGMGVADRNSVAGVVRAYSALKDFRTCQNSPGQSAYEETIVADLARRANAFKLIVGARLAFAEPAPAQKTHIKGAASDIPDIIVYPKNRDGWASLCQLLTLGNQRAKKGECLLYLDDLKAVANHFLMVFAPEKTEDSYHDVLAELSALAPKSVWLAATMPRSGRDRRGLAERSRLAERAKIPLLATNDALYATADQRDLQDVLTCIRRGLQIEQAGRILAANAERHLKSAQEMARLFKDAPQALAETQRLLQGVDFSLDQIRYDYPDEPVPPGWTAQSWLDDLVWRHAAKIYPAGAPQKVQNLLKAELALIAKLDYAPYFLTVYDIVCIARQKGVLCQGRGSAANSAVCYVLGITAVDPAENDVLFARFISEERREPPDIDIDFEHERREEIIQHIYEKYGRHRAGLAAAVICYRPRSALRDVGKAMGLSEDRIQALSSLQWGSWGADIPARQIQQAGLEPNNPVISQTIGLARRLLGFPRHLSQHVGGFVLARNRLDALCPIGNAAMKDRTFIEWDKDDIDALGLMKVDILALGMLTCIRKAFDYLRAYEGKHYALADIPADDKLTYDMLCKGDSIGVFQVESRAQINMLPRLKPRAFYDLVIQVAIVRPGPIQGNMVHPYLRRRAQEEEIVFPAPAPEFGPKDELTQVLRKTKGVPLFQEQAMRIAMVAAEFSDSEANQLRRAMATFRNVGTIKNFEERMVGRMAARGYDRDFAQSCFDQIKGFGSYGFPESHAASFAKLVYISSFIKCHHPAIFACALLNAQPMGFYAPAQIVRDAAQHGVEIREIDVNHSYWDNSLERMSSGALALRLGFRQMQGIRAAEAERLTQARKDGFRSIEDLAVRANLYGTTIRALADADAFRSMGFDRRTALWEARRLPQAKPLPLFCAADARELAEEPEISLPAMTLGEQVAADYQTARLSLKAHPMQILRPRFQREGFFSCAETSAARDGAWAQTAGLVLVRQRPGKGNAIFITLEDETGVTNVIIWARLFERYRRETMAARLMLAIGRVQKSTEGVTHLMAHKIVDRSRDLDHLLDTQSAVGAAPVFAQEPPNHRHPRKVRVIPKSRDFH